MPDFVGQRDRKLKGVKVSSGKLQLKGPGLKGGTVKGPTPLEVFRKLLEDFKIGIGKLRAPNQQEHSAKLQSYQAITEKLGGFFKPSSAPAFSPQTKLGGSFQLQSPASIQFRGGSGSSIIREVFNRTREFGIPVEKSSKEVVFSTYRPPVELLRAPVVPLTSPTPKRNRGSVSFNHSFKPDRQAFIQPIRIESAASPARGLPAQPGGFQAPSKMSLVTGADREAVRHVRELYLGRPSQFPAAARLAQVLRADSLVRVMGGRSSPQLANMAQAIREGRSREVADMDPDRVMEVLGEALGGSERAQQLLYTPPVHFMVERHRQTVQMAQARAREIGLRVEREVREKMGPARRGRSRAVSAIKSGLMGEHKPPATSNYRSGRSSSPHSFVGSAPSSGAMGFRQAVGEKAPFYQGDRRILDSVREPSLQALFMHNDFAHLPAAAEDLQRGAEDAAREAPAKPEIRSTVDRRTKEVRTRDEKKLGLPEAPSRDIASPSMPSVSGGGVSAVTKVEASKPSMQRLTGELKLSLKDGTALGTAEFEGSLG